MKPRSFMIIAGEASGDKLGAELVRALRLAVALRGALPTQDRQPLLTSLAPQFHGAGGACMAAAGVDLAVDLTRYAVIGLFEVMKNVIPFKRSFQQLLHIAITRQPDAIIGIDFSGFNRRFTQAIQRHVRSNRKAFYNWNPKIIQFVSPQLWASRPGRARSMERDCDLVLSIFPFEKDWYASHAPRLRVEFVGHPLVDRYPSLAWAESPAASPDASSPPQVLLLPGSRLGEVRRHAPVILSCARLMVEHRTLRFRMVLPTHELVEQLERSHLADYHHLRDEEGVLEVQVGGLPEALLQSTIAIASTGTVTMECAYFGIPTVTLYKTSWATYQIAKRIVHVRHVAMPNILAGETIFPEYLQDKATPENLAQAALHFLDSWSLRTQVRKHLAALRQQLGAPGACQRAAQAILSLFP